MSSPTPRAHVPSGPLERPLVDSSLILRTRVLGVLEGSTARIVCLAAPSGYGKSTTLAQWVKADPRPVAWVTAEAQVSDPLVVAQRVVRQVQALGLATEGVAVPVASDSVAWHLAVLPAVSEVLAGLVAPVIVVVDDAGVLEGPAWESLLDAFADHLPEGSTLALATRTVLPAALRRRRGSRDVLEMGPATLALDAVEGAELLSTLGIDLSDDAVLRLLEQTEGWPAAVYLSGLAVKGGRGAGSLPPVTYGLLADFIRDGVFDQLEPETARFLLRCSVLNVLDGPTCQSVSGMPDALARLRRLASLNHLVIPLDDRGERFRLHHLLATFLRSELQAQSADESHAAHGAASRARDGAGDYDAAVFHAMHSGDDEMLGALVWKHAGTLLGTGRMPVVKRWLGTVDDRRVERVPRLALAAAWVAQQSGDVTAMTRWQAAAERELPHATDDPLLGPDLELLAAVVGIEGLAAMERSATSYLAATPRGGIWRTVAHYLRGVALALLGDTNGALADLGDARRLAAAHEIPVMQAHAVSALVIAQLQQSDQRRGLTMLGELREVTGRHPMDFIATTGPIFAASAYGYLVEGRALEARKAADTALRLTSLMTGIAPWHSVHGRLLLSQVYLGLGMSDRAALLLEEAELAHGPATYSPAIDSLIEQTRTAVEEAGRVERAPVPLTSAEIRVLQFLPTYLTFPEIAAELFVSRNTVKTQALSVYRKLGAHSRGEAIATARRLGVLPPG